MTKRIRASVNGMYSVLKKGAQRFVVLAPHLQAYGKSNDGNKVDVSKKGDMRQIGLVSLRAPNDRSSSAKTSTVKGE